MSAAFPPLEDESPGAVLNEHLEHPWRGHMQISGDSARFKRCCLIRATARDDSVWGAIFFDYRPLLSANLLWHEAQNPYAPGLVSHPLFCGVEKAANLVFSHQRKCQKWQTARQTDGLTKFRNVAYTRHWTLHERKLGSVRYRQRRTRRKRLRSSGSGNLFV